MNKFRANIIKAKAIPKGILLNKISEAIKKKLSTNNIIQDEFTFAPIGNKLELITNYQTFFNLLPSQDELQEFRNEILSYANALLQNKISIFGKQNIDISLSNDINILINEKINPANRQKAMEILQLANPNFKPIDWNTDFFSHYTWDSTKKSVLLEYQNLNAVDVKVAWEFGRLQHLPVLAYASVLSDDPIYLATLKNHILSFIAFNPPGYGIQWKSSMDVAIRAINLIIIFTALKKYNLETDIEFDKLIISSILKHSEYIYTHLEWNGGLRGNHYIFNLAGIIIAEIFLSSDFRKSARFNFALQQYRNEILYQFNRDGGNFEASIPYHFFTSEIIFLTEKILMSQNIDLANSDVLIERLEKIKQFTLANVDGNNRICQIGDNDSGYVVKLKPVDIFMEDSLNRKYVLRYLTSKNLSTQNIHNFKDTGIFIRKFNDLFFSLRCGNTGQKGKGGHAHNDTLSITLRYKSFDFFVDPGTYCYLPYPNERNKFRSTRYHNTLSIAGKEQNIIFDSTKEDLFWLIDRAKAKVINLSDDLIQAVHYGFGTRTEREIIFNKNKIIVTDKCYIDEEKQINFHLHPDIIINETSTGIELMHSSASIKLNPGNNRHIIESYDYSPAYGVKKSAKKIIITSHAKEIKWEINY